MIFYKIKLDEKFFFILIIGIAPIAIDGIGQLLGFWESTNLTRFITGLLTGFICGVAFGIVIDELKEINVLKK
jgi:uncharacterized membrane protein